MANFQPRSAITAKKITITPANSGDTAIEIVSPATGAVVHKILGTGASTTGAVTFASGATVSTGQSLVVTTADKLTVGGVIVPQAIEVTHHAQDATAMVDQSFFVANRAYQVIAVREVHAVAEATAVTLLVQVTKDTTTDAPGAGTNLLTNTTNAGFDCKATANTVQVGTLTATGAALQLAVGDRLSVDYTAAATELVGVTISCTLKPI